jgi:hypothetical protein
MGVFYHNEPLRSKTLNTMGHISHTIHEYIPGLATTRSKQPTPDIVISMYREDPAQVALQIQDLLAVDPVRDVEDVHIIIYVKDFDADTEAIKITTNATEVIHLSNLGREGGTFLTHIIMSWEFLARHTMFIQANMHSFEEAKNRISDYFASSTGVLPLGTLEGCDYLSCKDPWDNQREFPRLPQLYSALNGQMCPKRITLSYLGQLVVSADRIRSRPRGIYEHIRAVLESDMKHFIHEDPRQERAFADAPSEPYFGHTLERSWMLLFSCEDVRILDGCAGWDALGRRRQEGDPDNRCQCLDRR